MPKYLFPYDTEKVFATRGKVRVKATFNGVQLWKDEAPRVLEIPAAFQTAMKKEGVLTVFEKLSYTHRKECCRCNQELRSPIKQIKPEGNQGWKDGYDRAI